MNGSLRLSLFCAFALLTFSCGSEDPAGTIPTGGSATKLWFGALPSRIIAVTPFSITVNALRTDNVLDASFAGVITIAKASGPGKLNGTLTHAAVAGVATFSGLTVDDDGDYTFLVSSPGLVGALTPVIPADPAGSGPAIKLGFVSLPASVSEMTPFTLTVQAQHGDNSIDPSYTGTVTLSLSSGSGTLSGTLSRSAVAGEAVFPDLEVSTYGTYYFSAVAETLLAGYSGPIAANPLAPTVVGTGTFVSQNGYTTSGNVDVVLMPDGSSGLITRSDFLVSSGAGEVGVWLTDGVGAADLNQSTEKVRVGSITTGFGGVYEFPIPSGAVNYTHVVTFSDGLGLNFGNAELVLP